MEKMNWKCMLGLHAWSKQREAGFGHQIRRSCSRCGGLQERSKPGVSIRPVWQWK